MDTQGNTNMNMNHELDIDKETYSMEDFLLLMKFLRSEKGCPWDREQTHQSIKNNAVEEAYEVIDAIDSGNPDRLADELGDLLLQVVFHSQIGAEAEEFDFTSVLNHICKKLISRHTHLFGDHLDVACSSDKVLDLWEKNKKKEKNHQKQTQVMKDVPRGFPALSRAYKIQKKAHQVGFDWDDRNDVIKKIQEELAETEEAAQIGDPAVRKENLEMEVGDLLFAVVNYARFLGVEPEIALDKSNQKFIRRFEFVEETVLASDQKMEQMTLSELDQIWDMAKQAEKCRED